ncbi:MAG: hypothetical protein J6J03_07670 [Tyzzerella sp.]|nr:hypothetical protein [Tyzzerella sp.]
MLYRKYLRYNKEEAFEGLDSLKVKIGTGSVICMAGDLSRITIAGGINVVA